MITPPNKPRHPRAQVGDLTSLAIDGDFDNDGTSDPAEYIADTDPEVADGSFRITNIAVSNDRSLVSLTWTSRLSCRYHIEGRPNLLTGTSEDSALGEISPDSNLTTSRQISSAAAAQAFFVVRVKRPFTP